MKLVVKYSPKPPHLPQAVGDSFHDLGRILGISASAVSHAVHRNSELYKVVEVEEWWPDNDGNLWYYDPDTGRQVIIDD